MKQYIIISFVLMLSISLGASVQATNPLPTNYVAIPSVIPSEVVADEAKGNGTTYYVDFENGSDAATGTKDSNGVIHAWKHAPGDGNATGIAYLKGAHSSNSGQHLQAGDTIVFRGGVRYRGSILVFWGGSAANPIRFDGVGWEDETGVPAIFDGSNVVAQTPCTSAVQCDNAPDWQH